MHRKAVCVPVLLAAACARAGDDPASDTMPPIVNEAEIVAPGSISTAEPEFAFALSPDGSTAWFNRASEDRSSAVILEAHRGPDGAWQPIDTASFSGRWFDVDPFITADGALLYFTSDRPTSEADTTNDLNTWVARRTETGWGEPVALEPPLNTDADEVFVSATRNGTLYFTSDRDGTSTIWEARSNQDPRAIELQPPGGNPMVDPDGRFMIVVVRTDPGGPDLHVSCNIAGVWQSPRPLGNRVNSGFADFAPSIAADGMLYFTSERPGIAPPRRDRSRPPGDVYRIDLRALDPICPD